MAKFIMECPSCGKYVEASSGFFAKKKIDCVCGHTIDVKTEKVTSTDCANCGNNVVFDQSKGDKARCPVCGKGISLYSAESQRADFFCPTCSCKLSASKGTSSYTCPLCDTEIDVVEESAKYEERNKGLASVIKYEGGNDIFIWKHPIEDFNLGTQLIVHESQEAIFFRDGRALDLFGAGRYTLATHNIPLLEELYKIPLNADTPFHSEVYFINMTTHMGIKWGTDTKVRLFDPGSGLHIEIGACGSFNLRVKDSRKLLLKVVGTEAELGGDQMVSAGGIGTAYMVGKFKSLVMNKVKANLSRAIKESNIDILEIDSYMDVLSQRLGAVINETLDSYGLYMPEFYITSVMTPDDDPNFRRLKEQFAERTLRVRQEGIRKAEAEAAQQRKLVEAQTEAQLKVIGAQAEAEAYKMQAYAEAEEMKAKGYTYQQETARMVGMEAMQNGITGGEGGGAGGLGDVAGLGVALGAMGGVIGMTRDALSPVMAGATDIGAGAVSGAKDTWDCTCGQRLISSKFCPNCGSKRPEMPIGWDCTCGRKGISTNFCPDCGSKRPEDTSWDCTCGRKGISTNFCPDCGKKKGE
ncbi:MAG: SPFH domain-containing protein [Clostridia bacterium]|nr:SPFH domain-containing protein [Clostridia bacterium]